MIPRNIPYGKIFFRYTVMGMLLFSRAVTAGADILPDPTQVDFAEVLSGQPVSKLLTIYNPDKTPVIISTVRTSCPCVTLNVREPLPIAPGQSVDIAVCLNPETLSAGAFKKFIFLQTNRSEYPLIVIPVKGTIQAE